VVPVFVWINSLGRVEGESERVDGAGGKRIVSRILVWKAEAGTYERICGQKYTADTGQKQSRYDRCETQLAVQTDVWLSRSTRFLTERVQLNCMSGDTGCRILACRVKVIVRSMWLRNPDAHRLCVRAGDFLT